MLLIVLSGVLTTQSVHHLLFYLFIFCFYLQLIHSINGESICDLIVPTATIPPVLFLITLSNYWKQESNFRGRGLGDCIEPGVL